MWWLGYVPYVFNEKGMNSFVKSEGRESLLKADISQQQDQQ